VRKDYWGGIPISLTSMGNLLEYDFCPSHEWETRKKLKFSSSFSFQKAFVASFSFREYLWNKKKRRRFITSSFHAVFCIKDFSRIQISSINQSESCFYLWKLSLLLLNQTFEDHLFLFKWSCFLSLDIFLLNSTLSKVHQMIFEKVLIFSLWDEW